jgi:hypothetical protein
MHICDARVRRAAAPLLLIGLLIAMLPLRSDPLPVVSGAAATLIPLSLGFSPSALYPVADGIPVYTVGDTIWSISGYNYSVPLSVTSPKAGPSATAGIVAKTLLGQNAITSLYTFTANDTDGVWNVTLTTTQGVVVISVHFVNLAAHPVSLGPLAYSLDAGTLSISTTAKLGDSYDQEVCAAGNATRAGVSLSLPTAMNEVGNITLTPGTPLGVVAIGNVTEPFSFWIELYHTYALDIMNTSKLEAEDLMAADSQPLAFNKSGTANTTLAWNMPVLEGQYEMRAYFRNSTSLDVVDSSILIVNESSWVSLTNDCVPQPVKSSDISYPASLTNGESNWPATFYLMYQTFGVEGVASYPVMANLSSVDFTFPPWREPSLNVNVNGSTSAGVLETSQEGSTLFVLSSQYPTKVSYTLDVNGENDLANGTATLVKSYSTLTEPVSLALLTVQVLSNRNLPTVLDVTGPLGVNISSSAVGVNQTVSFFLPTGTYTVTGLQANESQSAQTSVKAGLADSLTLSFQTVATPASGSSYATFEIILVATAVVAAVTIVAVRVLRVRRSRSLRARMANLSKSAKASKSP